MRTTSRWFPRRVQQSVSPKLVSLPESPRLVGLAFARRPRTALPPLTRVSPVARRALHTQNASLSGSTSTVVERPQHVSSEDYKTPTGAFRWTQQLNELLPSNLRLTEGAVSTNQDNPVQLLDVKRLEKIAVRAKQRDNVELFVWMVENGHKKAAVWLMQAVLSRASVTSKTTSLKAPSNIDWPSNVFETLKRRPISLAGAVSNPDYSSISEEINFEAGGFANREMQAISRLISRIWESLGYLVIRSTFTGTEKALDENMQSALLVLGHIHNLGAVPVDVYSLPLWQRQAFAQRPPILNLVSSRIMRALSDVAWRQQQDDAIIEASEKGMSLKEISQNVPGGRFRLRVDPLRPEVWLELILWCCIESQNTTAAANIIKALSKQVEDPWFAVRWTSPSSGENPNTTIDWHKINPQTPGTHLEGYSRGKSFVDMPTRTISVEVVLNLVERLIEEASSASLVNASKFSTFVIHRNFRSLKKTMAATEDMISFLEPHDLPPNYFDYLETRLLHDGAFDVMRDPADLYTWSTRMKSVRALRHADVSEPPRQTLELSNIYAYSELHEGFQHQTLNAMVQFGDLHNALAVFNEIQENVDKRKIGSIAEFLQHQQSNSGANATRISEHEHEFTHSYGQLPNYKLAGFLNLVSDAKLIGLGRWLLYADDVDGALLPEHIWGDPCITAALFKFAAVSGDETLLSIANNKRNQSKRLPSVNMQRALADAKMDLFDLPGARSTLRSLRSNQAGGYGLSNVVHLAAAILRLEASKSKENRDGRRASAEAKALMTSLLRDAYTSTRSDFTIAVRRLFKQQVRHILSVFTSFEESALEELESMFGSEFPKSNLPCLPARDFNILLAAAIDTRGSSFGRQMWDHFCQHPEARTVLDSIDRENAGYDGEGDVSFMSKKEKTMKIEPATDHHDDDLIPFSDPFFPQGATGGENDGSMSPNEPSQRVPVTIPNLQTLRLIVRAAANERIAREEEGLGVKIQKDHLDWAFEMFKAFEILDKNIIEQELQYQFDELESKMLEEIIDRRQTSQTRKELAEASEQDLSAGAPVSTLWIPPNPVMPKARAVAASY